MAPSKTTTGVTVDRGVGRGATFASITGRIGIEEANELQRRFDEVFKAGRPWVIISMRDVDFICSAGMGTLLSAVGESRKSGGEVIFTDVSAKVRTIFEFLDIWDYITTAPDKDAALEMVTAGKRIQARQAAAVLTPSFIADDLKAKLNAGVRLSKEGKLKDALAYLNAVLKSEKDNVSALTWKANVLERLGQLGEARRLYRRVCEIGRGDRQLLAYARNRFEKLNQKLDQAADRDRVYDQLKDYVRELARAPVGTPDFLKPRRTVEEGRGPFLEWCRTWDDNPLYGNDSLGRNLATGGGMFLWAGGRGIVVDPGKNFVARFAAAGYRLVDIDAIVVTSVAWDHNADLEPLVEVISRYNKAGVGPVKRVETFVNAGVYKRNYSWLSAAKDAVSKLTVLYPGHAYRIGTAALDVKPADVPEAREDDVLGFILTAGDGSIGYVADAGCRDVDVLAAQYRGARGRPLVAYVGGAYADENVKKWYGDYLGVEALSRLLSDVRPQVALLGKVADVPDPVKLGAAITKATNVRCVPLDVGFRVNVETSEAYIGEGAVSLSSLEVGLSGDGRLAYKKRD